jgi:hypothetical protein
MLSDYQKEQLSAEIIPMFQDLEQDTIQDIARRLRKEKRWTETAELQAKALESLGYSPRDIQARVLKDLHADKDFVDMLNKNTLEHKKLVRERIRETVDSAQAHGDKIVGRAGDMSFANDVAFWKSKGQNLKSSPALKQIAAESSKRLEHELKTLTHSTGFKFTGAPVSVNRVFNHSMDKAVINVASGAFSSEQAVEQVVSDLEKSGLRYVNYASGVTRGIDVAAHLAVRTTLNQMAADISMSNAEQLGTDLVEVSSHGGARDGDGHANHAGWQGKVYSISGKAYPKESKRLGYKILSLEAATGYPHDPAGLCGYNCKHTFYPFIVGISDPTPMEKEPAPVKVDGKTYTYYQATQHQRRLERELREFKRQHLGGQNRTAAITAKEQQYARFCEKAGLKQNLNRLYVKGYKRDFEYIKTIKDKNIDDLKDTISDFYNSGTIKFNELDKFNMGKLSRVEENPLLDGSDVYIEGRSLKRIINKHGHEMTRDEFLFIEDTLKSPDYYADNSSRHENSLMLFKELPEKRRYMECIFVKRGESYVIHFHKMGERKLRKLKREGKLFDIRE